MSIKKHSLMTAILAPFATSAHADCLREEQIALAQPEMRQDLRGFHLGDIGPDDHGMGEVSIALAEALSDTPVNARNGSGQAPGPYQIVVFPRSRFAPAWPVDAGQLEERVAGLMLGLKT